MRALRQVRWLSRLTVFGALALVACAEPPDAPRLRRGGPTAREVLPPEGGEAPSFNFQYTYTTVLMPPTGGSLFFATDASGFSIYASATSRVYRSVDLDPAVQQTYSCWGVLGCNGYATISAVGCPYLWIRVNAYTDHYVLGFGSASTTTKSFDSCGYTPWWPDPPDDGGGGNDVTFQPTDGSGGADYDACSASGGELYDAWYDYDYDGIGDEYIGRVCMYGLNMS